MEPSWGIATEGPGAPALCVSLWRHTGTHQERDPGASVRGLLSMASTDRSDPAAELIGDENAIWGSTASKGTDRGPHAGDVPPESPDSTKEKSPHPSVPCLLRTAGSWDRLGRGGQPSGQFASTILLNTRGN